MYVLSGAACLAIFSLSVCRFSVRCTGWLCTPPCLCSYVCSYQFIVIVTAFRYNAFRSIRSFLSCAPASYEQRAKARSYNRKQAGSNFRILYSHTLSRSLSLHMQYSFLTLVFVILCALISLLHTHTPVSLAHSKWSFGWSQYRTLYPYSHHRRTRYDANRITKSSSGQARFTSQWPLLASRC